MRWQSAQPDYPAEGSYPAGKGIMIQTMVNTVVPMILKHQVDEGGAFCIPVCTDGGQHGRDTGADILTKQNVVTALSIPISPADSQGLQDSGRTRMRTG